MAKDYDSAATYFDQIFQYSAEVTNKNFLVRPVLYSGILNFERGNIQLARQQLEEGLDKIKSLGSFPDLAIVYQYMSKIHVLAKEYSKARQYLEKALEFAEGAHNKRELHNTKLLLVNLDNLSNLRRNSLQDVEKAYQWALENGDNILLKESSNYLANYYIEKGQFQSALAYKEVYAKASEKKAAKEKLNEIALLKEKTRFEQEARDRELNERALKVKLQVNTQNRNLLFLGVILLLVMSLLLLYSNTLKNEAYTSLREGNRELRKTEKELAGKNAELQKYIESNIQLEQFAHIASHDLRAPLITINSFAKLLEQKTTHKLTENESKYLDFIRINGAQMSELVNDLLAYSKINSQKIEVTKISIQTLVEEVKTMFKNQAAEKQVAIHLIQPLPNIVADEVKIKRVFQNLIDNAIKFSAPEKASKVELSFEEDEHHWRFNVQDNGIGMKDNNIDIFQPYTQLNRKADYKGTGLGLSFCQKIVQQHGGEIGYASNYGKGSCFHFTIAKELNQEDAV